MKLVATTDIIDSDSGRHIANKGSTYEGEILAVGDFMKFAFYCDHGYWTCEYIYNFKPEESK
jgi:hypothetical protein